MTTTHTDPFSCSGICQISIQMSRLSFQGQWHRIPKLHPGSQGLYYAVSTGENSELTLISTEILGKWLSISGKNIFN